MTKTTVLSAAAATLAAALFTIPLLAGSANATTTSKLLNCQYNSKQKVMDCCQRIVNKHQRPMWMTGGNGSCANVVKCSGGTTYLRKCFIQIPRYEENSRTPSNTTRGGRGNNGNSKPF